MESTSALSNSELQGLFGDWLQSEVSERVRRKPTRGDNMRNRCGENVASRVLAMPEIWTRTNVITYPRPGSSLAAHHSCSILYPSSRIPRTHSPSFPDLVLQELFVKLLVRRQDLSELCT